MIVLDAEPSEEAYALDVARALRRGPAPTGGAWMSVAPEPEATLADELARMEALFFDLDLENAERAARDTLRGMDEGAVRVDDDALLLRTLLRAAQIFDAQNADADADDALRRASAARPGFELAAREFPPSLIERHARLALGLGDQRHTLRLEGLAADAEVRIDGAASRARELSLPAGTHVVLVSAPGHRPWQRTHTLDADATLSPELEVDSERLHRLPETEAQRFLALHDALALRLQITSTPEGRRARLAVPGDGSVSVVAPLDEEPAALAARLVTEREAQGQAAQDAHTRQRRRRAVAASLSVAVAGAGAGAYVGLRPEATGWRGSGALAGDAAP